MIKLSRIDGRSIIINADEIEIVETLHDTTLTLKSGKKVIVKDSADDIIKKIIEYRKQCFSEILLKTPQVKSESDES